jgi:hypothetical protein
MHRCKWGTSMAAGLLCLLAVGGSTAFAQGGVPRVELGGQLNVLRLSDSDDTNVGVGGRVTFNLASWLGLEGEYQFVPRDEIDMTSTLADGNVVGLRYERRRSTALFGLKAGSRGERFGVFAKMRPGVTSLSDRGIDCLGDVCGLMLLAVPEYRSEFALDLGGVVEFYPSTRWLVRADVGSLMIRHRSTAPPCGAGDCTTWNLAVSAGAGIRF